MKHFLEFSETSVCLSFTAFEVFILRSWVNVSESDGIACHQNTEGEKPGLLTQITLGFGKILFT